MIKKLALTLSFFVTFPAVSTAGVPVIEETSVVFTPLQYMEQLQTQLNTINQYEQMIIDYENQIRQLENLVVNTRFDNIKISNLQDLQNTLNIIRSRYEGAIQQYNSVATRSNKLMEDGCDFLNKYELCSKEQQEVLESLGNEIEKNNKKLIEDNDPSVQGSTASLINKDLSDLEKFDEKISGKAANEYGTNQFLSDERELSKLTNKQLLDLRQQTLEMKNVQREMKAYWDIKELKRQQMIKAKYIDGKGKWKTNKIYKDQY
jgi:P-type conjugative transfer protein TrbJ